MTIKEVGEKHVARFKEMGDRGQIILHLLEGLSNAALHFELTHEEVKLVCEAFLEVSTVADTE